MLTLLSTHSALQTIGDHFDRWYQPKGRRTQATTVFGFALFVLNNTQWIVGKSSQGQTNTVYCTKLLFTCLNHNHTDNTLTYNIVWYQVVLFTAGGFRNCESSYNNSVHIGGGLWSNWLFHNKYYCYVCPNMLSFKKISTTSFSFVYDLQHKWSEETSSSSAFVQFLTF